MESLKESEDDQNRFVKSVCLFDKCVFKKQPAFQIERINWRNINRNEENY